jgi:hypothetical protein
LTAAETECTLRLPVIMDLRFNVQGSLRGRMAVSAALLPPCLVRLTFVSRTVVARAGWFDLLAYAEIVI